MKIKRIFILIIIITMLFRYECVADIENEEDAYTKCAMASTTNIISTKKILLYMGEVTIIHQSLKVI